MSSSAAAAACVNRHSAISSAILRASSALASASAGFGLHGLTDRSRRLCRQANKLPDAVEEWIVRLKRQYPTRGGAKDQRALADCFRRRKVNVSQALAGQAVGVRQVEDHLWLVTFMHYDLGYFDEETRRLEPIANPFGPAMSPMSSE